MFFLGCFWFGHVLRWILMFWMFFAAVTFVSCVCVCVVVAQQCLGVAETEEGVVFFSSEVASY